MNYVDIIRQFNTAEISDALDACGIEGALFGIKPLLVVSKIVGRAFTVKYLPYENFNSREFKSAGDYIDEVSEGSVIIIDNNGRTDCTTWGDILTQVALLKKIEGTVVNGAVRDVENIRSVKYPIYSCDTYMRSGKNRVYKSDQQCQLIISGVLINPGDYVMADDNGVVIIPLNRVDDIISKARNIRTTEDDIIASVKAGLSLTDARLTHRYDQPWLNAEEK